MIYLTGDTHGNFAKLCEFARSEEGKALTKDDFVIVLGDFGVWQERLDEIKGLDSELPYTLMFLDGNHEDFRLLESLPKSERFGGEVHDIGGVCHLCRGEIFDIPSDGEYKRILVCGGGRSVDAHKITEDKDWFPEEEVSESDVKRALENAGRYHNRVDALLSHSPSSTVKLELYAEISFLMDKPLQNRLPSESEYRIRDISGIVNAKHYYCGHEHIDRDFQIAQQNYSVIHNMFKKM